MENTRTPTEKNTYMNKPFEKSTSRNSEESEGFLRENLRGPDQIDNSVKITVPNQPSSIR